MSFSSEPNFFSTLTGKYRATTSNGVLKIRNIRYAYSDRYQPPKPVEKTQRVVENPSKTPVCPQNISPLLEKMIESTDVDSFLLEEATQFLTITLPDDISEDESLPVIVWIHGGSYEIGCGDVATSSPDVWVKEQRIIVVAVSYRLGLFGFLGGSDEIPANLGLMDIIEALKWTKINIQFFGGDSENICLMGQSSGGDAVAHLLLVDDVQGLFNRVIIQSAPLGLRKKRQKMSHEFLMKTSLNKNESDVIKMVADYKKNVPSIMKYGLKAAMPFGIQYGHPPLCKEQETDEKWKKNARKADVLIGLNDDETAFYLRTSEALKKYLKEGIGKKILDKTIRLTTEKIYGKPAQQFAENYANGGGSVYLFRIHAKHENNTIGAAHCIDLPLLFGNEKAWKNSGLLRGIPWEYIHENGKEIRKLWAEFARTGNISVLDKPDIVEIKKIKRSF